MILSFPVRSVNLFYITLTFSSDITLRKWQNDEVILWLLRRYVLLKMSAEIVYQFIVCMLKN